MEILHTRRGRNFWGILLASWLIVIVALSYVPLEREHTEEMNEATVQIQIERAYLLLPQTVCIDTSWHMENISAVLYNGNGVVGQDSSEHCIDSNNIQAAHWEVVFQDGSSHHFYLVPTILARTFYFHASLITLGLLALLTFGPVVPLWQADVLEQRERRDFLRLSGILVLGGVIFGFGRWRDEQVVICNGWVLRSDEVRSDSC